ncbi:MAG TPA: lipoxygenase family protein [Gemmataceae bacterium]|nr:lipoxygenase family protein [Gemmataceae bacterium]
MTAFLPQYDSDSKHRKTTLEQARAEYQYNHTYLSPLAVVEKIPYRDEFSCKWIIQLGERVLRMVENHIKVDGEPARRAAHQQRHNWFSDLVRTASCDFHGIARVVKETLGSLPVEGPAESLDDFAAVFRAIGLPAIARDYHEDSVFAEMRVAGPNPIMICQVAELDDRFPVTEEHFRAARSNDSLEAAKQEGRLFLADYKLLEQVENGRFSDAPKYVYAPLALFVVDTDSRKLMPVAIQCRQEPGADNPIFTPDDGYNWLIAKTIVGIADGNYHEAIAHLGRTHLFVEPFVIATHRQLAPNHPLHQLLQPHFEGTLAINRMARGHLVNEGGPVDHLFGGTLKSTVGLTLSCLRTLPFNDAMLPRRLKNQGLSDTSVLPHYPYRDDSLLLWGAIRQWVADYLAIYYRSDAGLQEDTELAGWFAELVSPDAGRVIGLQYDGTPPSLPYLTDVLTMIIFTCSVQHAAVNFPQYDLMSYVPSMPLAAYSPAPTKKKGATLGDYLAMLPKRETAVLQAQLGYMLGSLRYTTLGQYGSRHFRDSHVQQPQADFEKRLGTIGETIEGRNRSRRPYPFLVPSGIPQSINV